MPANRPADDRKEIGSKWFLEGTGQSKVVQAFLAGHGKERAEASYAMQLEMCKRQVSTEGPLGWNDFLPSRPRCRSAPCSSVMVAYIGKRMESLKRTKAQVSPRAHLEPVKAEG